MIRHTNVTLLTDSDNTVRLLTNRNWNEGPTLWLQYRLVANDNFEPRIFHIPGNSDIAKVVLSRHSFICALNSITTNTNILFSPLLRSLYSEHRNKKIV